jgi:hypothetical protein
VGTVTEHAVEEAKKFSDTLAEAHKNSIDLARALVGPLLEALNQTVTLFKDGKKQGQSFYGTLFREQLRLLGLNPDENLAQINTRIEALNKLLEDGNLTTERRTRLETQLNGLLKQRGKLQENSGAGGGRGFVNPSSVVPEKPSLNVADPEAAKALDDLLKKIRERGDAERLQIKTGRDLTDAEKYQVSILAELPTRTASSTPPARRARRPRRFPRSRRSSSARSTRRRRRRCWTTPRRRRHRCRPS